MKINIQRSPENNESGYAHMQPIVDFLLKNGNELTHANSKWGSDRTGYVCWLKKPIDKTLVLQHFNLPDTIIISESGDLDCHLTYVRIKHVE